MAEAWIAIGATEWSSHIVIPRSPFAAFFVALGMAIGLWLWGRVAREQPQLVWIALAGLAGGLVGAKVGFWLCEAPIGWNDADWWFRMATGKTVLGALLGGWIGVELTKRSVGYRRPTGDLFAAVIPTGIALGRVGCLLHGCCQGIVLEPGSLFASVFERWPAPGVEIGFQFLFLGLVWILRKSSRLAGQHFHLYLIGYGFFRLAHEPLRATPRYPGTEISPYMILAGVCVIAGSIALVRRGLFSDRSR